MEELVGSPALTLGFSCSPNSAASANASTAELEGAISRARSGKAHNSSPFAGTPSIPGPVGPADRPSTSSSGSAGGAGIALEVGG